MKQAPKPPTIEEMLEAWRSLDQYGLRIFMRCGKVRVLLHRPPLQQFWAEGSVGDVPEAYAYSIDFSARLSRHRCNGDWLTKIELIGNEQVILVEYCPDDARLTFEEIAR
jgi:hypothetical protein